MEEYFHSVTLQEDKCIGCTDCIKRCPTEAIRVRHGKARIINERCIDCGLCIRVCRSHAKKAITDPLACIGKYAYKVAIPAPTLYAQFKDVLDINIILTGLKRIGFDEVFEVAKAAEMVTKESAKIIKSQTMKRPIISSACPVIVRLIQIRFPSLIDNILSVMSPMEVAARTIKAKLALQGMDPSSIGVFFISPCAAKATNAKNPLGFEESHVDGVISMRDIYMSLLPVLRSIEHPEVLRLSTEKGIGWAAKGGEGHCLGIDNSISVDGIENVIKILEKVENGKLEDVDFIEGLACIGGCVGGPLTVENSFVAKNYLSKIAKYTKNNSAKIDIYLSDIQVDLTWSKEIISKPVLTLDQDMIKAIQKLEELEKIYERLPQINCGSCGAPTCRSLAEDIVREQANIEDCIFMLREKVRKMAQEMVELSQKLPPSISSRDKK